MATPTTPVRNRLGPPGTPLGSPLSRRSPSAINQSPIRPGPGGSHHFSPAKPLVQSPVSFIGTSLTEIPKNKAEGGNSFSRTSSSSYLPPLEQLLQGESKRKERELQRAQSKSRLVRINSLKPGGFIPFSAAPSASSGSSSSPSGSSTSTPSSSSSSTSSSVIGSSPSWSSISSSPASSSTSTSDPEISAPAPKTKALANPFAPVSLPRVPSRQPPPRQPQPTNHQPPAQHTQASLRAAFLDRLNAAPGRLARSNISNAAKQMAATTTAATTAPRAGGPISLLRGSGRGLSRSLTTSHLIPQRSNTIAGSSLATVLGKRPAAIAGVGSNISSSNGSNEDHEIAKTTTERKEESSPFVVPEVLTGKDNTKTTTTVEIKSHEKVIPSPQPSPKRLRRAATTSVIASSTKPSSEPVNQRGLTLKQQGQMSLLDLVPGGYVDHTRQVVIKRNSKTLPPPVPQTKSVASSKDKRYNRYIPIRPDPEKARYHMQSKHNWRDYADIPYVPSEQRGCGGFRSPDSVAPPTESYLSPAIHSSGDSGSNSGTGDILLEKKATRPRTQLTDAMTQVHNDMIANVSQVDFRGRLYYFTKEQEQAERARMPPTTLKRYQSYQDLLANSSQARALDELQSWKRPIRQDAEEVLDAPGVVDDFYTSLLDWSSMGRLAVGVGRDIFVRDTNGEVGSLMRCPLGSTGDDYLTALKWSNCGKMMAYGTDKGDTMVREIETGINYLKLSNRRARVSCLSWNGDLVFQGFRTGGLRFHDIRTPLERVGRVKAHEGVVCGMAWNKDGIHLATGGNDNLVKVWDCRKMAESLLTLSQHQAAIKALAWCPYGDKILASGGGSQDKKIYFWDTSSVSKDGECLVVDAVNAEHAVTSIQFSKEYEEFAVSHGPELSLFTYPKLATHKDSNGPHHKFSNLAWSHHFSGPAATRATVASTATSTFHDFENPKFKRFFHNKAAHQSRILHTTMSPDGVHIATVAADSDLKMWRLFQPRSPEEQRKLTRLLSSSSSLLSTPSSSSSSSLKRYSSLSSVLTRDHQAVSKVGKNGVETRDSLEEEEEEDVEDRSDFDALRARLR